MTLKLQNESDVLVLDTTSPKLRVKRWAIGSVDTVHEDDA